MLAQTRTLVRVKRGWDIVNNYEDEWHKAGLCILGGMASVIICFSFEKMDWDQKKEMQNSNTDSLYQRVNICRQQRWLLFSERLCPMPHYL